MAAPLNPDEFLDLVRKSDVVDEKRLETYLQKMRGNLPTDLGRYAGILVKDGLITHFQAEQFLQGKWRRFTIGKYKVLERLGSGGMGSVYLCEHKFMRRRVAVKVLPPAKADDPSALERFYREARAVAALDHPNIVRAYDIDKDEKLHFLVMEYVDGSSLQELIKKHGPMDVIRAAHYMAQSAVGLQHAYQTAGLIHRDIKPGNVLIDRNGIVKILDMGLARFFHDEEDILTRKYDENVLGTADYLAPEQAIDSHSVDIRADIYSLGATFYFILTGCTPFMEGTVAQKLIWHQTKKPKAVREIRLEIPEGLALVLEKMMAKKPEDRYQTPGEVVQALAPWTQTAIPAPPEKEMPRLCPAAMGSDLNSGASSSSMPRPSTIPPTPLPRTPAPTQQQAARPPASPAAQPRPAAAPVARMAPPQRPGTATMPQPSANAASTTPSQFVNTPPPARPAPARPNNQVAAPPAQPAAKTGESPDWGAVAGSPRDGSRPGHSSSASASSARAVALWQRLRRLPYFWYGVAGIAGLMFLFILIVAIIVMLIPPKKKPATPTTQANPPAVVRFMA